MFVSVYLWVSTRYCLSGEHVLTYDSWHDPGGAQGLPPARPSVAAGWALPVSGHVASVMVADGREGLVCCGAGSLFPFQTELRDPEGS